MEKYVSILLKRITRVNHMIDRNGYRSNVGIIILNKKNEVFWGKRIKQNSWQFPQGGINPGENPKQAMYRELTEETGLHPCHVEIVGRTRDWLRYEVPDQWIKREWRGNYKGQKQIWYLLRLVGRDSDVSLRTNVRPEFDAWRWNQYWIELESVVKFKRQVYYQALTELALLLNRESHEINNYEKYNRIYAQKINLDTAIPASNRAK